MSAKKPTRKLATVHTLAVAPRTGRITRPDQAYAAALREYADREQAAIDAKAGTVPPAVIADAPVDPVHFAACPARHVEGDPCCCEYERRVQAIEDEGATRSDAQSAVDAEIAREKQGLPPVDGSSNPQRSPVDESANEQEPLEPPLAEREADERGWGEDCDHEDDTPGTQLVTAPEAAPVPPTVAPQFAVPIRFLQAALCTTANNDIRYYLNGVFLHAVDGELRIVATDGHRMLVSRFAPQGVTIPAWLSDGVILPRSELAACLPLLDKNATFTGRADRDAAAFIDYASVDGQQTITLSATNGFCAFRLRSIDGKFPDYQKVLDGPGIARALAGNAERGVMETSAFNTKYLRGATDVAAKLGAIAINAFLSGNETDAGLFTFSGAPDSVLVIMPMRVDDAVSSSAVKLLGSNAVSGSIAALRAHMTRTVKLLGSVKTDREREQLEARKASFENRIAGLVASTQPAPKQLTHNTAA